MAKRRTREQKIIAQLRRQLREQAVNLPQTHSEQIKPTYEVNTIKLPKITARPNQPTPIKFSYDPKLIKRDLVKTAILSVFFLGAIIFIQRFFHL